MPSSIPHRWAAALLALLTLSFHAIYWDRFISPSVTGMFHHAAERILAGQVPHKDFFLIVPVLHPLKLAALLHVFGNTILITRAEALLERIILALLLFYWLKRIVRLPAAFLGSLLAIAIFASDPADSLACYHHDSAFWAVCAGFTLTVAFEKEGTKRWAYMAVAGFFAGLCFWTKQTTGLGVTAALPILATLALGRRQGLKPVLALWLAFFAGWLIPFSTLGGWLAYHHAFDDYVRCVFGSASAKGSGLQLLLRPILQWGPTTLIAALAVALGTRFVTRGPASGKSSSQRVLMVAALVAAAVTISVRFIPWPRVPFFPPLLQNGLILCGLHACTVIAASYSWRGLKRDLTPRETAILLFGGTGFAVAYMLSLSWAAFGPMVVPSLAIATALLLDRAADRGWRYEAAFATVALALFTMQSIEKAREPFFWMEWAETSVATATETSKIPILAGLKMTPATRTIFDGVTQVIRDNSTPRDTLLAYPYFPLFYSSTGLWPPTYTYNHFMDVTPDWIATSDAELLRRKPPNFLILMVEDPDRVQFFESVFRGGAKSQTRLIGDTITGLTRDPDHDYKLLRKDRLPGSGLELQVWQRSPGPSLSQFGIPAGL